MRASLRREFPICNEQTITEMLIRRLEIQRQLGEPHCRIEEAIVARLNRLQASGGGEDRDAIRYVFAVQGDVLDFDYIHSWCDRHGTRQLLDEIRASIPPID